MTNSLMRNELVLLLLQLHEGTIIRLFLPHILRPMCVMEFVVCVSFRISMTQILIRDLYVICIRHR